MAEKYVLIDLERSIGRGEVHYWKQRIGYTNNFSEVGLYTEEQAKGIVKSDFDNRTVAIKLSEVEQIRRTYGFE